MSNGINKVILIGNLGNDPDVKTTDGGLTIASVSIATTDSWTSPDGVKQERTEWHKVIFFKKLAEIVGQYLKKGAKVYIEGKLQTRKWQDKDNNDRYTTEVVARDMQMLSSKPGVDALFDSAPGKSGKIDDGKNNFDMDDGVPF